VAAADQLGSFERPRSRTLNSPEIQSNEEAPRAIVGLFHAIIPARTEFI